MMRLPVTVTAILAVAAAAAAVPALSAGEKDERVSREDLAAIRAAALDYAEGWYEGDPERMERAVHPELAKRIVHTQEGRSRLDQMGAMRLVQSTRAGYGKGVPAEVRQADVEILDVYGGAASVRVTMHSWIDYMHLAKWEGQWKIVNVLWELKPEGERWEPSR